MTAVPSAKSISIALAAPLLGVLSATTASAQQRIENQVAVFAALDKVTARISKLEVKLGETARFGALTVTPRACFTRPPTEQPKTTTFVEVQETELDGKKKSIFKGWMLAESPGLNAVEHPVYDVWLTECAQPRAVAQGPQPATPAATRPPGRPGAAGAPPAASGGWSTTPVPANPTGEEPAPRRRPPR